MLGACGSVGPLTGYKGLGLSRSQQVLDRGWARRSKRCRSRMGRGGKLGEKIGGKSWDPQVSSSEVLNLGEPIFDPEEWSPQENPKMGRMPFNGFH